MKKGCGSLVECMIYMPKTVHLEDDVHERRCERNAPETLERSELIPPIDQYDSPTQLHSFICSESNFAQMETDIP